MGASGVVACGNQKSRAYKALVRLEGSPLGGRWHNYLRLISAHSVLLMPNSLMKPSASATPQSAACA